MLRCILGRAGSGKTEHILKEIQQAIVQSRQPLIFLVPEQFSFETERTLLQRLGVKDAAKVEVLSFTRLAEKVFCETGGTALPIMDDVTRALIMSRALEVHTAPENLAEDAKKVRLNDTAYISSLLALASECKQCAVTPRLLAAAAKGLPDGTLKSKTADFAALFDVYESLSLTSGIDPEDILNLLVEKLPETTRFCGATVFVDGFKGFTVPELRVLGYLMKTGSVTVTLPADKATPLADTAIGGLFAPGLRTLQQLREVASENGVTVEKPLLLEQNHRTQNEALRRLEAGMFLPRAEVTDTVASAVTVTPCPDTYAECAAAARTVRRLLREKGYRASDVAIVVRDLDRYRGILDRALRREDVPFYMDIPQDVYTAPLVSVCLSALRIAANGLQTEELLRICKSGILPFDEVETATLENYVYMWRIDGKKWQEPFTANPAGLTEKKWLDEKLLASIENIRRRLIAPLMTLRTALREGADGETFARALYEYLTHTYVCADEGVRRLYGALIEEGEPFAAECTARLWESVMLLLDRFATVFAQTPLSGQRYAELFHLAAGLLRLPSVPQGLDAVQVGSADHMRVRAPKAVLILGANEGVFPAYPAGGNLFTDREREQLETDGIRLSAGRLQKAEEERFYAYTAVAAPSEELYVFYALFHGGEKLLPSAIVENIDRILSKHTRGVWEAADGSDIESATDAVGRFAAAADNGFAAVLKDAIIRLPESAAVLERVENAEKTPAFSLTADNAAALFGREMRLSSSQLEKFQDCPFSYFCNYGMRLQERRLADIDARNFGTFAHYVLEKLLPVYVEEAKMPTAADIPTMRRRIHALLLEYVDTELGGMQDKTARFRYLMSLVENTAFSLLWFVVSEMAQSEFKPAEYELSIGGADGVPSPRVSLDRQQGTVHLTGKVDRVDLYRRGDEIFVRVVDYKTSKKTFSIADLPYGLNMQMLIYLFAVCNEAAKRYEADTAKPAGVLYLSANKAPQLPLGEKKLKTLRMNGLLVRDAGVLTAMEQDGKGTFIPASLKNGDIADDSSVASYADFETIRMYAEALLRRMATRLLEGDIAAVPTGTDKELPCRYCAYRRICRRREQDPFVCKQQRTSQEVLDFMEEVNGNGMDTRTTELH